MNLKYMITILSGLLVIQTSYIIYKIHYDTKLKEGFSNPLDITDELKDFVNEFEKLEKNVGDVIHVFDKIDDKFTDLFSIIKDGDFFKNLGNKLLNTILDALKKYLSKFLDILEKELVKIIPLTLKIIWKIITEIYAAIEKQVPEIVYIKWGLIILAFSPIYPFISFQMNILSFWINPLILVLTYGALFAALYLNWQKVLLWIITAIWNILKKIDYVKLAEQIVMSFKPLLEELISVFK